MQPRYVPTEVDDYADVQLAALSDAYEHGQKLLRCSVDEPYMPGCPHSWFRDLLRVSEQHKRAQGTFDAPVYLRGDPGEIPCPQDRDDSLEVVKRRLATVPTERVKGSTYTVLKRDLGQASGDNFMRPSSPGYLADLYGQANRQVGRLAAAIDQRPLEPGMVDTSSGQTVLYAIPRLSGGAAVATQASQNAAIQETDPTTTSYVAPVETIAGLVDMSRQAFDFSRPGLDEAITDDLARATAVKLDAQLVAGSGASGQMRGLANVSGILTASTSSTTVQGQLSAIWSGFSTLAGSTGFGNPDPEGYLTIMHPRRFAWLSGGSGGTGVQNVPNLPGDVVLSSGIRTNLGAGTNEDEVIIAERSNLVLVGGDTSFSVFEEVGSGTLTVRTRAHADAALVVKNPAAILRISGFANPTF